MPVILCEILGARCVSEFRITQIRERSSCIKYHPSKLPPPPMGPEEHTVINHTDISAARHTSLHAKGNK